MRCHYCEDAGKKHRVYKSPFQTTTLMNITPGYWDENNDWVPSNNPNISATEYNCSNGHCWTEDIVYSRLLIKEEK